MDYLQFKLLLSINIVLRHIHAICSDSERIFLAKIPRKALKGKEGVNIEYRFNKNGDVIYSSQYNVILDKKKGLNEVEMSYYAGTDGVDVPEYNIYGK